MGEGGGSEDGLDLRRRRARYRAWHRGMREMDLIMGPFADAQVAAMGEADLDAFERLIEVPDRDLYGWIIGDDAAPEDYDTAVFRRLKRFHASKAPLHD
jgi:antitoxin CptB